MAHKPFPDNSNDLPIVDPLIGTQIDEYRLQALLGSGGMARVYRAVDVNLNRAVAIKVIDTPYQSNAEYARRFKGEAQAIAQLDHPHIVHLYRYGQAGELFYMAMQFISGMSLGDFLFVLRQKGAYIDPADALRIIREVGEALDYAHSLGVIHRDVKPSNIMLDPRRRAILTDFGLALLASQSPVSDELGSPHYLAPEQALPNGRITPQTDLYALGVILFEMFTGQRPYSASDPYALAQMHLHLPPPSPRSIRPAISPAVEAVILKAMEKDPRARFQRGQDLAEALDQALLAGPAAPPPPAHPFEKTLSFEKTPSFGKTPSPDPAAVPLFRDPTPVEDPSPTETQLGWSEKQAREAARAQAFGGPASGAPAAGVPPTGRQSAGVHAAAAPGYPYPMDTGSLSWMDPPRRSWWKPAALAGLFLLLFLAAGAFAAALWQKRPTVADRPSPNIVSPLESTTSGFAATPTVSPPATHTSGALIPNTSAAASAPAAGVAPAASATAASATAASATAASATAVAAPAAAVTSPGKPAGGKSAASTPTQPSGPVLPPATSTSLPQPTAPTSSSTPTHLPTNTATPPPTATNPPPSATPPPPPTATSLPPPTATIPPPPTATNPPQPAATNPPPPAAVIAPPSNNSRPSVISQSSQNLIIDCGGRRVTVNGNNNTLTLTGACPSLTVHGNNNQIIIPGGTPVKDTGQGNVISQP